MRFDEKWTTKEEPQALLSQTNWKANSAMSWWSTNENLQKIWQPPITIDDSINISSKMLDAKEQLQSGEMSLSDGNKRLQSDEMSLSERNERFQFCEMSQSEPEQQPEEKSLDPMIQSLLGQLLDCGAQIPIKNDLPTIQNPTLRNPTSRDATFGLMQTSGVMTVEALESLPLQNKMVQMVNNQTSCESAFRSNCFANFYRIKN